MRHRHPVKDRVANLMLFLFREAAPVTADASRVVKGF
jgi:hypothetical protein